jgi:hypothetical protein
LPNPNYTEKTPIYYYLHKPPPPNYAGLKNAVNFFNFALNGQNVFAGLFLQDDAAAAYSTLEQTQHSSNPNVYFQVS